MTLNIPESTSERKELDQSKRDENTRSSAGRGQQLVYAGSPIEEPQESQNGILLLSGNHGGFRLKKPGTRLTGVPGALVTNVGIIESNCILDGLHFGRKPESDNDKFLLRIASSAKVLIKNCTFERLSSDASSTGATNEESFILVESGAKAIILQNTFRSSAKSGAMDTASGHVVKHIGGAAANVWVGLGFNLTGQTHSNVTPIAPELT